MSSLSQYAIGDIRKSILVDYNQNSPYRRLTPTLQSYKPRELNKSILNENDKTTESKYDEIRKKYGNRERSTSDLYQSRALQEITLRNSQYMNASKVGIKHQNLGQKLNESYGNYLNRKSSVDEKERYKQETTESYLKTPQKIPNIPKSNAIRSSRQDSNQLMRSVEKSTIQNVQQEHQRVNQINKINMKIHQILNCLNQTSEKKNTSISNEQPNKTSDKSISINNLSKPKFQQQKQSIRNSILQKSSRQPMVFDQTRRLSMNSSYNAGLKKSITPNEDKVKRRQNSIFKDRDIDAQIRRIQERIKKTQQQKKKLNLSDKQWRQASLNRKPSRDFKHSQKASFVFERKNRLISKQVVNNSQIQNEKYSISISKVEPIQQKSSFIQPPSQIVLKQSQSKLNIPQLKQSSYKQSINKATQVVKDIKKSIIFNEDLLEHQKIQTKKLVETLKNQVVYDQHWRNAKAILSQRIQPINYQKLQSLLKQNGIILSIQGIKKQLQLTLQQHNPFFSVRQAETNQSFEELIGKYIKTSLHWQTQVKGKFDSSLLTKQKFNQNKIDLEKKGTINIEDFVRFLNIETGNFYRNRDLVLLFRRLSKNDSIMYQEFVDVICSQ